MIADAYEGKQMNTLLNRFHMWFPGGIVLGSLISKFMTDASLGWQTQIWIIVIPTLIYAYLFLIFAVVVGTASNNYAKSAEGFTLFMPSFLSAVTIILCMYGLSNVMKVIPIGITYASFAGLCIMATTVVGVVRYNQIPNLYTIVGLTLIVAGVIIVNLFGINK